MSRFLGGSYGGMRLPMGEVPLWGNHGGPDPAHLKHAAYSVGAGPNCVFGCASPTLQIRGPTPPPPALSADYSLVDMLGVCDEAVNFGAEKRLRPASGVQGR